ncbi:MAG TPA: ATP-dependent helicase [Candidatus Nealsonbacteria bacterium]|uniref:Uncharacterized protein n=1 Tax=marine sediment metagenome TaxID=412755 RepID=A0A0F9VC47_9ZZZZ|nr:ATP-dependent helicase [Candidatus Nealsonbacteria bacterium]HEB46787.1 ATP-dependent helicase [Candidatus Nealsonbacteria bacterium]
MKKEFFIVSVLWSPSDGKYYLIQRKSNNEWSLIGDRVKCDTDLINIEGTAIKSIRHKTGYAHIECKGEIGRVDQDDSAISRTIHFFLFYLSEVPESEKIKEQKVEKKGNWFTFKETISRLTPEVSRRILYQAERKIHTDEIIISSKPKIVVAAGPGTGKTFLFEKVCKKKENDNNLIMTFINELVNDLKFGLGQLADVRTLHSFVMNELFPGSTEKPEVFMQIADVISEDFNIIEGRKISFKDIFNDLLDRNNSKALAFYFKRRKYYDCIGPSCAVYDLIKHFEKDKKEIPQYSQILIDEFQDFNKLEIKLLDLLADESPILIVGDDDQSLYDFKNAYPEEIRSRCLNFKSNYFYRSLPFCSRCPKVIIDSVNTLISKAEKGGFLKKRIPKRFEYFCSEEKDAISKKYQNISYRGEVQRVDFFIDKDIKEIFERDRNFSVLIICAHGSPKQKDEMENYLREKGFRNIQNKRKDDIKMEGYELLLKDSDRNLGWRILSKDKMKSAEFKRIIVKSKSEQDVFRSLLPKTIQSEIKKVLKILKKINDNIKINDEERKFILNQFSYNPSEIAFNKLKKEIKGSNVRKEGHKDISIKIVNPLGSKGLSADYVFLVNFNEDKVTNELLCQFIVSITRVKKKLYIYSQKKDPPTLIEWIKDYLE